jgi:hypothetical protein
MESEQPKKTEFYIQKLAKASDRDSFVLSVRPSVWNNSAPTGRIFMKCVISVFLRKSIDKIQVLLKSGKNNGHLT